MEKMRLSLHGSLSEYNAKYFSYVEQLESLNYRKLSNIRDVPHFQHPVAGRYFSHTQPVLGNCGVEVVVLRVPGYI